MGATSQGTRGQRPYRPETLYRVERLQGVMAQLTQPRDCHLQPLEPSDATENIAPCTSHCRHEWKQRSVAETCDLHMPVHVCTPDSKHPTPGQSLKVHQLHLLHWASQAVVAVHIT